MNMTLLGMQNCHDQSLLKI